MKNFQKIGEGLITAPLLMALARYQKSHEIWKADTYLRDYPQGPFGDTESVILRFPPLSGEEMTARAGAFDQHENIDREPFAFFPEARGLIFDLMAHVQGERLGRVVINKLRPGGQIFAHVDGADHAAYYDRYHIVLQSGPGANFRCGDETVNMRPGECWWFNNAVEHEVVNNGADDRIHLIIDIRTRK